MVSGAFYQRAPNGATFSIVYRRHTEERIDAIPQKQRWRSVFLFVLTFISFCYSTPFSSSSSSMNSSISPGWQFSALHIALSVEKRTALTFPVLILERLTLLTPTRSLSSLRLIFLSAMTLSRRNIIDNRHHLIMFHRPLAATLFHNGISAKKHRKSHLQAMKIQYRQAFYSQPSRLH